MHQIHKSVLCRTLCHRSVSLYPRVCDLLWTCYQLLSVQESVPDLPSVLQHLSAEGQWHRLTQRFTGILSDEREDSKGSVWPNLDGWRIRVHVSVRLWMHWMYVCTHVLNEGMNGQMYVRKWQRCSLLTGTGDARSLSFCSPRPSAGWSRCKWGQGQKDRLGTCPGKSRETVQMCHYTLWTRGSALGKITCSDT